MVDVRRLSRTEITAALEDVAALRIEVFRAWPYLYDGDLTYERNYLKPYAENDTAVIIGAFDDSKLIGAATGMPLLQHADDFSAAFADSSLDLTHVFYCAESVLLPSYRGRGVGHRFFDLREAAGRDMGCTYVTFCSVERPSDHPARPSGHRTLEPFWRGRGYQPLEGSRAYFSWKDLGETEQSVKTLQFWGKSL